MSCAGTAIQKSMHSYEQINLFHFWLHFAITLRETARMFYSYFVVSIHRKTANRTTTTKKQRERERRKRGKIKQKIYNKEHCIEHFIEKITNSSA